MPPIRLATPLATTRTTMHERATRRPGTSWRMGEPGLKLPQTTTTERTSLPDFGVEDRRSTTHRITRESSIIDLKSQKTSGKKSQTNQRRGGLEKSARHIDKYLPYPKQRVCGHAMYLKGASHQSSRALRIEYQALSSNTHYHHLVSPIGKQEKHHEHARTKTLQAMT